jgi:hypothetical protein
MLASTVLTFAFALEDTNFRSLASFTTLDGREISSGETVALGWHKLVGAHPKFKTIETNVFVWYGANNIGDFVLERERGTLAIAVDPPARLLMVRGPDFQMTLTNAIGITSSVPTDSYGIEAKWLNSSEVHALRVKTNVSTSIRIAASLGSLNLETEPAGAVVLNREGGSIGLTPLLLQEVPVGRWRGQLRSDGFIPVSLSLNVPIRQTNYFTTNLVNSTYAQAMQDAPSYFASGDYDRALAALIEALRIKPDDVEAKALQRKATLARLLMRAKMFYDRGDSKSGLEEAQAALKVDPSNVLAATLIAEIEAKREKQITEQEAERIRKIEEQNREVLLKRPKAVMETLNRAYPDSDLFASHSVMSSKSVKTLGDAIRAGLVSGQPSFEITKYEWPDDVTFVMEAKQKMFGSLRQCLIVGVQVNSKETWFVYKVLEYETHLNVNLGNFLKISDGKPALVPIHPGRINQPPALIEARIAEGIRIVSERLKQVIGD